MGAALNLEEKYTYGDYLKWPDDERWELIHGIPYSMSPAPKWEHQGVEGDLFAIFYNFLKGKPCKVFTSPFDVRFPVEKENDDDTETVVQPDILVLCDRNKLQGTGCIGAPDLVIEILSGSTAQKDMTVKKDLYEANGVKEYWIVDIWTKSVRVYLLKDGKYGKGDFYEKEMVIEVDLFKDLKISLKDIFNEDWD